jgi:hypothetical protein
MSPTNITITTIRKGGDMLIMNNLKLVTQFIFINPKRLYNETIYPINPFFLSQESRYI